MKTDTRFIDIGDFIFNLDNISALEYDREKNRAIIYNDAGGRIIQSFTSSDWDELKIAIGKWLE